MATHDYVISNGTGSAVRSDLNGALAAIVSNNSSATQPATMYAYQWWADTTTGLLKIRNSANSAWVTLFELDGTLVASDISLGAGSAAAPSLFFTGDTNTGLFSPGADTVALATAGSNRLHISSGGLVGIGTTAVEGTLHLAQNDAFLHLEDPRTTADGSHTVKIKAYKAFSGFNNLSFDGASHRFEVNNIERARIDSSGRLLVGTSTSVGQGGILQVVGGDTARPQIHRNLNDQYPSLLYMSKARGTGVQSVSSGDEIATIAFDGFDGTQELGAASIRCFVDGTPGANDMPGRLVFSTTADGAASPTERMRIANNGAVLVATTSLLDLSTGTTNGINLREGHVIVASRNSGESLALQRTGSDGVLSLFFRNTTLVGSISVTASATAYNTSSDYRLKENLVPLAGAIDRINSLQVHRFNFIADPDKTVDGFLAHEAQAVVPECVTGEKDEVDADGNPVYQGIDQSKLVPLLTAALQEAIAKIEALETRLTAAGIA